MYWQIPRGDATLGPQSAGVGRTDEEVHHDAPLRLHAELRDQAREKVEERWVSLQYHYTIDHAHVSHSVRCVPCWFFCWVSVGDTYIQYGQLVLLHELQQPPSTIALFLHIHASPLLLSSLGVRASFPISAFQTSIITNIIIFVSRSN